MEYILFIVYLVLFAWLVTKVKFFTRTGLSQPQLIIIFLLKVMAGIFYGWIGLYYGGLAQMQDTWGYHYHSIQEYNYSTQIPMNILPTFSGTLIREVSKKFFQAMIRIGMT